MAVRNDFSVDFIASPRIITVAAPSVEVTIQDLHDTLRTIEDDIWNMSFPKLISSAGKENLGGGTSVGITSTLQNAKLKFADRGGPTYVQCSISGGNLVANDANGVSMSPIEPSAFTQVTLTSSSSATIANLEIENIQYMIESLRRGHQGYGKILYWDPLNGDDNNDGASPSNPKKTYAATENAAPVGGATIFISTQASTQEIVVSERIVMTKNSMRLRGPGSFIVLKPNDDLSPTITMNGTNCYVSGVQIKTASTGFVTGIQINGDWGVVEDALVVSSSGHGIYVNGNSHHEILGCDITSCGGDGIHVLNADRTRISQSKSGSPNRIQRCTGNGITINSTSSTVRSKDTLIEHTLLHHNGPYEIENKQYCSMTIIRKTVYASPWNNGAAILDSGSGSHNELAEMVTANATIYTKAIWDELISNTRTANSIGKRIIDVLKLKRVKP